MRCSAACSAWRRAAPSALHPTAITSAATPPSAPARACSSARWWARSTRNRARGSASRPIPSLALPWGSAAGSDASPCALRAASVLSRMTESGLSDFLRDHREEILASWEASVRTLRAARDLPRPILIDHLPQFIDDLADYVDHL